MGTCDNRWGQGGHELDRRTVLQSIGTTVGGQLQWPGDGIEREARSGGRAYLQWGDYYRYAESSDEYLGFYGSVESTLEATSQGYFETTTSC